MSNSTSSSIRRQRLMLVVALVAFAVGVGLIARTLLDVRSAPAGGPAAISNTAPSLAPSTAPSATHAPLAAAVTVPPQPAQSIAPPATHAPLAAAMTATPQRAAATATLAGQTIAADVQATARAGLLAATATAFAPQAPAAQAGLDNASSAYAPDLEPVLLDNGYQKNLITVAGRHGLRASQRNYSNSFWTRDLDYAISGYSYPLGNMDVFADNIDLFLSYVAPDGVAPETIYLREGRLDAENRQSWDSMPNLIHAVYVYVAKTGDRELYRQRRDLLQQIGLWIVALDSDGDSMPDRDIFPFGYYDSVENGVLHTYALAKFYAAYNELAELEESIDNDGAGWRAQAASLRAGFHQPLAAGGYWPDDQPWPIAWRHTDGREVRVLETFGVFEALRSGMIAPSDGPRYEQLIALLHARLPELMDGPSPMRLTLGGYEPEIRRVVDPPVPLWMLDNSAPWIVGIAAPAYAAAGLPDDARTLLDAYMQMARNTDPPVLEFAAGSQRRYGAGDTGDRGRTWDSAAWFLAVYSGHYGLHMTPSALLVRPQPFAVLPGDVLQGFSYQGAMIDLALDPANKTYRIKANQPLRVLLQPMGTSRQVRVDGGPPTASLALLTEPGQEYVVVSE